MIKAIAVSRRAEQSDIGGGGQGGCAIRRAWLSVLGLPVLMMLSSCAGGGVGYYWQSVTGHLNLMRAARPIEQVVADPATSPEVSRKLALARKARAFAVSELSLPDNGSYTRYAALDRPYVLWNVFAADELSLTLKTWCFPVAGCIAYRGYYRQADAQQFAESLGDGMDIRIGGVPAYSTLGWFDDPLPSPVLRYPDVEIARLIFHELAHQVVYLKDDSTFNESFATAVETVGVQRWLAHREALDGDSGPRRQYEAHRQRKADFLALLLAARSRLEKIYAGSGPAQSKRAAKQATFEWLRQEYRRVRDGRWSGYSGYDRWFEQPLGNAHLAAVGAYNDRVTAFLGMLDEVGGDLGRFYTLVREVADLEPDIREQKLDAWHASQAGSTNPAASH